MSLPTFAFPAFTMLALEKLKLTPKNPKAKVLQDIVVLTGSLTCALPLSVAIYPQRGSLDSASIDDNLKNIKNSSGMPV